MKKAIILLAVSSLFTQDINMDEKGIGVDKNKKSGKIENMLIWRLTDDLELSTGQAEVFFPRFREHREMLKKLAKEEREQYKGLKERMRDESELSISEVREVLNNVSKLRKERIDIESNFILKLGDILSPTQMLKVSMIKQSMMNEIRNKKDKKQKKRNRKKNKQGYRERNFF